ncbi:MAG: response regulator [Opitutaceae bacterium]|nr:response regulator [Opitutaceae bacterium]
MKGSPPGPKSSLSSQPSSSPPQASTDGIVAFPRPDWQGRGLNTKPPSTSAARRLRILTVDDAKAVRLLAQRALAPLQCEFAEAANGYNALFAMERALPDLLLLDVMMPTMGGVELLTLMRSNPTLKGIPVIMLTSPADHAVLPELNALGIQGLLVKPVSETLLAETARKVLGLAPAKSVPS